MADPKKWSDITSDAEFKKLAPEAKAKIRDDYYWRVVGPNFGPQERQSKYDEWVTKTSEDVIPKAPVARSAGEYILNEAKKGVSDPFMLGPGLVDATTSLLNLALKPLSAAQSAMNKSWGGAPVDYTIAPPKSAERLREAWYPMAGIKEERAPSGIAEYAGNLARWGTGLSLPSSALVMKAPTAGAKLATGLVELGSIAGGSTGEYLGRKIGSQGGEKAGDIGSVVGSLFGGGMSAMFVPKFATKAVGLGVASAKQAKGATTGYSWEDLKRTAGDKTAEYERSVAGTKLRDFLQAYPEAGENLAIALALQDDINATILAKAKSSGLKPEDVTLFSVDLAMSRAPAIEKLKDTVDRASVENLQRARLRREQNIKAVEAYKEGAYGSPQKLDAILSKDADARVGQYEAALADIEARKRAIVEKANPSGHAERMEASGRELRGLMDRELEIRKEQARAQYAQVKELADRSGFSISDKELERFISGRMSDPQRFAEKMPQAYGAIANRLKNRRIMLEAYGGDTLKYPESLTQWVASKGGLNRKSIGGDIGTDVGILPDGLSQGRGGQKVTFARPDSGMTADRALEGAIEEGFVPPGTSLTEFENILNDELLAGRPTVFRAKDLDAAAAAVAQKQFQGTYKQSENDVPLSFGEAHSIVRRLRRDMREAANDADRKMLSDLETYVLGKVKAANPEVSEALGQVDEFYRDRIRRAFYEGAAYKIDSRTKLLGQRTPDSEVARVFMDKGGVGANEWKEIFGNDQRANGLLLQSVLDDFASKVLVGKKMTPEKIQSYILAHDNFLIHFPELRKTLTNAESLVQGLTERGAQLEEQLTNYQQNALTRLVRSKEPETIISRSLADREIFNDLVERSKAIPGAQDALRRGVADLAASHDDPMAFIASHRDRLETLLGAGQMKTLDTLAHGYRQSKGAKVPEAVTTTPFTGDPVRDVTGIAIPSLFSRFRSAIMRRTGGDYMIVDIASNVALHMRKSDMMKMMSDAIYDPSFAKALMDLDRAQWQARAAELTKKGTVTAYGALKDALAELPPHFMAHGIRVVIATQATVSEKVPAEVSAIEQAKMQNRIAQEAIRRRNEERYRQRSNFGGFLERTR